jgi:hypothetical protein
MTTTTTTHTEYGYRLTGTEYPSGAREVWPDADNKVRPYGNKFYRGPGSIREGVPATSAEALRDAAKAFVATKSGDGRRRGIEVLSREVETVTTVEVRRGASTVVPAPVVLPKTPGSVVRASRFGDVALWTLTDDGDDNPWRSVSGSYAGPEELSSAEVLFEAPAA